MGANSSNSGVDGGDDGSAGSMPAGSQPGALPRALSLCSNFSGGEVTEKIEDTGDSQSQGQYVSTADQEAAPTPVSPVVRVDKVPTPSTGSADSIGTQPVLTFGPSATEQLRASTLRSSSNTVVENECIEYRIRFFNYNMGNSAHYKSVNELQGPGGRGSFADTLMEKMADGREVDIVFATLVETRLCMTEWVDAFQSLHSDSKLDSVIPQNARRECKKNTKSHVRSFMEGLAASYNGNLKSLLAFNSAVWAEEAAGQLFGRLTEASIAGLPIPNPKKAFMGRTVSLQSGLRLCFVGAHFPVAKLAAALEDTSVVDNLDEAKMTMARTLRRVLQKAGRRKIADEQTVLFVQGDLNSRTLLRSLEGATALEFEVELKPVDGERLGMDLNISADGLLVIIESVRGGLAAAWNLSHVTAPTSQLRVGDHIVEVNQCGREDGKLILHECQKEQALKLKIRRQATDVLLEVLGDDVMQVAIQSELDVPPGRWYEMVHYQSVHELPVTYKFVENVVCSSPKSSSSGGHDSGVAAHEQLTVGDVMSSATVYRRSTSDSDSVEDASPTRAYRQESLRLGSEPYKRALDSLGDDKLSSLGLAFNKKDFRAFRFPSCADRIVYWAPDTLAGRISWELPRGGYEVNHAQLGSDHRSVSLEAVLRVHPKEAEKPADASGQGQEAEKAEDRRRQAPRLSTLLKELTISRDSEQESDSSGMDGDMSPSVDWRRPTRGEEGKRSPTRLPVDFGMTQ